MPRLFCFVTACFVTTEPLRRREECLTAASECGEAFFNSVNPAIPFIIGTDRFNRHVQAPIRTSRRGGRVAEGGGLLNRYTAFKVVSRVRIPPSPPVSS